MICTLSKKFAKKDPTHFNIFVIILMSVSGRCSGISRADGRNASLEHIMVELGQRWVLSLRKQKLYRKGYREVTLHFHQWERELPRRSRLSAYLCDFYISSWSTQQRTRVFFFIQLKDQSSFHHRRGGGALEDFGGASRCFQGRKDGSQSSLTEHHERLLKIDCKLGGIIRMLRGHRGIR